MTIQVDQLEADVRVDTRRAVASLKLLDAAMDRAARERRSTIRVNTATAERDTARIRAMIKDAAKDQSVNIKVGATTDHRSLRQARDAAGRFTRGAGGGGGDDGGGRAAAAGASGWNKLTGSLVNFNTVSRATSNIIKIIKFPAYISAVSLAATAVNTLAAGTTGLVGAMGPLVGLTAALPTGFTLLGQAIATGAAGFIGLGDAMKASGEAQMANKQALDGSKGSLDAAIRANQKLKEVMDEQPATVKSFMDTLDGLRPRLKGLQTAAQEGLLPGVERGLEAASPLLVNIQGMLRETGREFGSFLERVGQFAGSDAFRQDFSAIATSNKAIFRDLGSGALNLAKALTQITVAARPLTEWIARSTSEWTRQVSVWAQAGRESGRLTGFFERTRAVTSSLMDSLGNLSQILMNVGRAAAPLGNWLLESLRKNTQAMADLTGEAGNLSKMTTYLNQFKEPLSATARLIADLGRGMAQIGASPQLAQLIDQFRVQLLPALLHLAGTVNSGFGPALISTLSELTITFGNLMGHSGALTIFIQAIGHLASGLNALVGFNPFVTEMTASFASMAGVVKLFAGMKFSAMIAGISMLNGGVGTLAGSFKMLAGAAKAAFGVIGVGLLASIPVMNKWKSMMNDSREAGQTWLNSLKADDITKTMDLDSLDRGRKKIQEYIAERKKALAQTSNFSFMDKPVKARLEVELSGLETTDRQFARAQNSIQQLAAATGTSTAEAEKWVAAQFAAGRAITFTDGLLSRYRINIYNTAKAQGEAALSAINSNIDSQLRYESQMIDTENSLKAYKDAQTEANKAASQFNTAAAAAAMKELAKAQKDAAKAQRDVIEARRQAGENLEDLQFAAEDAVLGEERAIIALQKAYDRLNKTQKATGKETVEITRVTDDFTGKIHDIGRVVGKEADSQEDLQDILLSIREAELGVRKAKEANKDAQYALIDANKKGIEGSDGVVAALERVATANDAVKEAQIRVREANTLTATSMVNLKEVSLRTMESIVAASQNAGQRVKDAGGSLQAVAAAQVGELDKWIARLGPNDPLTQRLIALRNLIREIQGTYEVTLAMSIKADTANVLATLPGFSTQWAAAITKLPPPPVPTKVGRASGGPASQHRTYKVGEFGPELLTMGSTSGYITPGGDMNGGLTEQQLERVMSRVIQQVKPDVNIDQTFNEKVDPKLLASALSWELQ